MNQVQWSETTVGRFEGKAWPARYLSFSVLYMYNNRFDGKRIFQKRESSPNFENRSHTQSTYAFTIHKKWQRQNSFSESIRYWPWPRPFVLWRFECLSFIILHLFTESEVYVIKRCKAILSELKCNQKVAGKLTFDLLTQRSTGGFLFQFIFWIWSRKPEHGRDSELWHLQKMFRLWVKVTLTLKKLP